MWLYCLVTGILAFFTYHFYWKRRNLPPGPVPFPFLGNLFQFAWYGIEEAIIKIRKDYGDLHTIWIGDRPIVVIGDFPTVIETYIKDGDSYNNHLPDYVLSKLEYLGGVSKSDGQTWKEQRKFLVKTLRDLGVANGIMEQTILTELGYTLDEIKDLVDMGVDEIDIRSHFDAAIGNVLNAIVIGHRFGKEYHHEFLFVKTAIFKSFEAYGHILFRIMDNTTAYLRYLPGFSAVYNQVKTYLWAHPYMSKKIIAHAKAYDYENYEPTDFVEFFVKHQKKLEKEGEVGHSFNDRQLVSSAHELWTAGQGTTATTQDWVFYYVTANPKIQAKIHEELDRVIGSDRYVTMADRPNLPYTCAVISEAQRLGSIGILNILHSTTKDVEIHGHKVAKGTGIAFSITSIFQDDRYFDEPEKFKPERFLDSEGKYFAPREFVPFATGKRICPGKDLALMELFLFTTNLFNHYKLEEVEAKPFEHKRYIGFLITPGPYVVKATSRF